MATTGCPPMTTWLAAPAYRGCGALDTSSLHNCYQTGRSREVALRVTGDDLSAGSWRRAGSVHAHRPYHPVDDGWRDDAFDCSEERRLRLEQVDGLSYRDRIDVIDDRCLAELRHCGLA